MTNAAELYFVLILSLTPHFPNDISSSESFLASFHSPVRMTTGPHDPISENAMAAVAEHQERMPSSADTPDVLPVRKEIHHDGRR